MMLLTGEFPGTERASGAGRWKASFTVSWPFSSSQPPQLTSCHPEERNKSFLCMGVPGSTTDIIPRGQKVSIIPALSGNSKPRDIAYQPNKQNKTNTSRCHETISHEGMAEDHTSLHTCPSATGGCFYGTFFLCN